MTYEKEPAILKGDSSPGGDPDTGGLSFETVLDTACERLREMHIQYTIRRIREMDDELKNLEHELDEFIKNDPAGVWKASSNHE